jgi:8-oxo-dGTP pyrophosphatase MutT (NUDIX family)
MAEQNCEPDEQMTPVVASFEDKGVGWHDSARCSFDLSRELEHAMTMPTYFRIFHYKAQRPRALSHEYFKRCYVLEEPAFTPPLLRAVSGVVLIGADFIPRYAPPLTAPMISTLLHVRRVNARPGTTISLNELALRGDMQLAHISGWTDEGDASPQDAMRREIAEELGWPSDVYDLYFIGEDSKFATLFIILPKEGIEIPTPTTVTREEIYTSAQIAKTHRANVLNYHWWGDYAVLPLPYAGYAESPDYDPMVTRSVFHRTTHLCRTLMTRLSSFAPFARLVLD